MEDTSKKKKSIKELIQEIPFEKEVDPALFNQYDEREPRNIVAEYLNPLIKENINPVIEKVNKVLPESAQFNADASIPKLSRGEAAETLRDMPLNFAMGATSALSNPGIMSKGLQVSKTTGIPLSKVGTLKKETLEMLEKIHTPQMADDLMRGADEAAKTSYLNALDDAFGPNRAWDFEKREVKMNPMQEARAQSLKDKMSAHIQKGGKVTDDYFKDLAFDLKAVEGPATVITPGGGKYRAQGAAFDPRWKHIGGKDVEMAGMSAPSVNFKKLFGNEDEEDK